MKRFLRRHALIAFFVLAFVLSWYPWLIALARGRTTGPNPLGPFLAGIIMTAIVFGRSGLREFFSRLVRCRVGVLPYVVALLLPVFVCLTAVGIVLCFRSAGASLSAEKLRELPERFIFIFFFIGLGEEPGWRGFGLPQLQTRRTPLHASLILAPIWALWHAPLLGNEFPWPIVVPFVISVFGGTFALTWLFNRARGSVLLPMLLHATLNSVAGGTILPLFSGQTLLLLWWIYSVLWLCTGLALLLLFSRNTEKPLSLP